MYKIIKKPLGKTKYGGNKYYDNFKPEGDVLHTTGGHDTGLVEHFNDPEVMASYNVVYPRDKPNEIWEFVPIDKGAWHAGKVVSPNKRAKEFIEKHATPTADDPNFFTYGHAYVGLNQKATDSQVERCAWYIINKTKTKDKPKFAHVEITKGKPPEVIDFKERVIKELSKSDEVEHVCKTLKDYTSGELLMEWFNRKFKR